MYIFLENTFVPKVTRRLFTRFILGTQNSGYPDSGCFYASVTRYTRTDYAEQSPALKGHTHTKKKKICQQLIAKSGITQQSGFSVLVTDIAPTRTAALEGWPGFTILFRQLGRRLR
ncbi:hypothetical protein CEXT_332141 [Caerostris extrusa]|uniref:Uncharacterized protein n=1 Tax=Caerostris extrusa TaxID=172846 RepID=A0AAV4QM45_CAEEX|nr:hypothetical protein CEXT_332141 [Caerostris extrusa]